MHYKGDAAIDTSGKEVGEKYWREWPDTPLFSRRGLLAFVPAAILLSACQTTRGKAVARLTLPLEEPPPGLARIYFYRQEGKLFRAVEPTIVVNGSAVGISRPGEAFYKDAKPGQYQIFTTAEPDRVLYLEASPGGLHFVEMEVAFSGVGLKMSPVERNRRDAHGHLDGLSLIAPGT